MKRNLCGELKGWNEYRQFAFFLGYAGIFMGGERVKARNKKTTKGSRANFLRGVEQEWRNNDSEKSFVESSARERELRNFLDAGFVSKRTTLFTVCKFRGGREWENFIKTVFPPTLLALTNILSWKIPFFGEVFLNKRIFLVFAACGAQFKFFPPCEENYEKHKMCLIMMTRSTSSIEVIEWKWFFFSLIASVRLKLPAGKSDGIAFLFL